jgi:ribose transport system ATP-binding protein
MMEASARENFSVVDVKRFWHKLHIDRRQERQEAQTWFNTFSVRPKGNVDLPLNAFSGGNQQKILLAKWLRCNPRVLLLDEPTQGVDIAAKAMIHRQIRMIADRGAGVIVSSSDVDEITALCDRVLVFRDGRIATILPRSSLSPGRISRESVGTIESTSLGNTQRVRSE